MPDEIDMMHVVRQSRKYVRYYDFGNESKGEDYKVFQGTATFLTFGINFVELDGGNVNFSTAIIELPDGSIKNIYVELIEFIDEGRNETTH